MVGSRETIFLSMLILFNVFIFMTQLAIVVFAILFSSEIQYIKYQ